MVFKLALSGPQNFSGLWQNKPDWEQDFRHIGK